MSIGRLDDYFQRIEEMTGPAFSRQFHAQLGEEQASKVLRSLRRAATELEKAVTIVHANEGRGNKFQRETQV